MQKSEWIKNDNVDEAKRKIEQF